MSNHKNRSNNNNNNRNHNTKTTTTATTSSIHDRKKQNAQRFKQKLGLESNDYGLNGQDFPKYTTATTATTPTSAGGTSTPRHHHHHHHASPQLASHPPAHVQLPPPPEVEESQFVVNQETMDNFYDDVGSLWLGGSGAIPVLDEPPSSFVFLRDYVTPCRPVIIRNTIVVSDGRRQGRKNDNGKSNSSSSSSSSNRDDKDHHHHQQQKQQKHDITLELAGVPYISKNNANNNHNHNTNTNSTIKPLYLTIDDIVSINPTLEIIVDATPDGYGDCIRSVINHTTNGISRLFVTPEQRTMTLQQFMNGLRDNERSRLKNGDRIDDSDYYDENDDNNDDLTLQEELYDDLDGKRIYGFKNSKPPNSPQKGKGFVNEMFATCGVDVNPTTILTGGTPTTSPTKTSSTGRRKTKTKTTTTTEDNNDDPFANLVNCTNPLNDMGELFLQLVEDKGDQCTGEEEQTKLQNDENEPPPPPPPPPPSVLYYSRQNDCLRTELKSIYETTKHFIPETIQFAQDAFNTGPPEAINLWMGNENVISSMHKDPYENMFFVASGEKIFTLCPPSDAPFLYEKDFLSGTFDSEQPTKSEKKNSRKKDNRTNKKKEKRTWSVKTGYEDIESDDDNDSDSSDDNDIRLNKNNHRTRRHHHAGVDSGVDIEPICPEPTQSDEDNNNHQGKERPAYVRWIEADVAALTDPYYEQQQLRKFPLLKYTHPIHQVRVQAGEMLYLPALWFHRVTQSCETVGINYWYNMNFNSPSWCYFQLLNQLQLKPPPSQQQQLLSPSANAATAATPKSRGDKNYYQDGT